MLRPTRSVACGGRMAVLAQTDERPWLDELNPEQRAAATHSGGPLLILAGAGTGKTTTLCARVAWLVSSGVPSERILLLTFTRRAAREMLQRARGLVPASSRTRIPAHLPHGGTFHSVAHRLVRRDPPAPRLPGGVRGGPGGGTGGGGAPRGAWTGGGVWGCSTRVTRPMCWTCCARKRGMRAPGRGSRRRGRCWTSTRARSTRRSRCRA